MVRWFSINQLASHSTIWYYESVTHNNFQKLSIFLVEGPLYFFLEEFHVLIIVLNPAHLTLTQIGVNLIYFLVSTTLFLSASTFIKSLVITHILLSYHFQLKSRIHYLLHYLETNLLFVASQFILTYLNFTFFFLNQEKVVTYLTFENIYTDGLC